jgi:decaprenylphospho-beta-D-ribofuranose 2-oxidase
VSDRRLLAGWGRTSPTSARLLPVGSPEDVSKAVRAAGPRGLVARGLGRSYGDAAQDSGGVVLDMTTLCRVHSFDIGSGVVEADAGLSLHALMTASLPEGWFVPVTPGTRFVTLGGAVAADIHGKNHHVDGSFGRHVLALSLVTADGSVRRLAPTDELFWATVGGMGLTGVVTRVRLQLRPVETSRVTVDTERASDLDDVMDRMVRSDADYTYSVAWVDLLARGRATGRSVLTRGRHSRREELPASVDPLAFAPRASLRVPPVVPGGLLRRGTVSAFNEVWFRKSPRVARGQVQDLAAFFHPLDGVAGWNNVYGPRGFVQYQLVVPDSAADAVREAVALLSAARTPSFLTVLKRFGPGNRAPLSFPMAGWTLALDLPTGVPGLAAVLARLDELVLGAGGRVYLAKDARLPREYLPAMYPRLAEWRALRDRVDPDHVFTSDLSRRLSL